MAENKTGPYNIHVKVCKSIKFNLNTSIKFIRKIKFFINKIDLF